MKNIIEKFQTVPDLLHGTGTSKENVGEAENELGVSFAPDYKEYLLQYGTVAYDGHEWTGISQSKRINVVSVTKEDREYLGDLVPADFYVVEEAGIDNIIIWQNSTGELFETLGRQKPLKIHDCLADYIES